MKKPSYTESQIFKILKEAEAGAPIPDLCRTYGMSSASFYKWRAKYGGMQASNMALNCPFPDLRGVSRLLVHHSILSRNGVSGIPGAVP